MSDNKFDIPDQFDSPTMPAMLTEDTRFNFRCHKDVSCFNACCKCADVTLAPYDIIRLKGRLGMDSAEFLNKHTVPFPMDQHKTPGLKLKTNDDGACLLLDGDNGCSVYEDRPTVCRYYPLGLLSMREKDATESTQNYSMISEEHCKGHDEDREVTVAEYREEQGVEEYDQLNRDWYQLILKKKSGGPSVGAPSEMSLQLFFMASYNADMFRKFVLSEAFKTTYDLLPETYEEVEKDDIALLKLGYRLLRQALFAEKTMAEQDGAWDKRVEDRKEVWEARTNAEVDKRNKDVEEQMQADTDGEKNPDGEGCSSN